MRRVPRDPNDMGFPEHLVVFDGRGFTEPADYDAYCDAYDAWCSAREAFEAEHEVVLPARELGEPPDALGPGGPMYFPHGGGWGPRDDDPTTPYYARTDGVAVVCAEHGLTAAEH